MYNNWREFIVVKPLVALCAVMVVSGCSLTTQPLTEEAFKDFAYNRAVSIANSQVPIEKPITIYEAMARAIKHNLDQRIEIKQRLLEKENLKLERYQMLPTFVANSGYSKRSNYSGGVSRSLITGQRSLESSTSSDLGTTTNNYDLSWSVLDFGLSYVRAQQNADKILIAEEQRRKVINGVIEDVRTAYWRAYAAQSLSGSLVRLGNKVERAMYDSQELHLRQKASPLAALTYQRELADIQREIDRIHGDLKVAKAQLGALINIPPGIPFTLAGNKDKYFTGKVKYTGSKLAEIAVAKRPEMRELAYQVRINEKELKAALLETLPNFTLGISKNTNSNSFLYNPDWVSWAAKASWKLIGLIRYPQKKKQIKAQEELIHARANAVAMAIIVQVYVSEVRQKHARKIYWRAQRDLNIQRKILRQFSKEANVGLTSEQTVIREQMNTVVSRMRLHVARASLENAMANLYASSGLDVIDYELSGDESLEEIAGIIKASWTGAHAKLKNSK